ncbi:MULTISPECIES: maleylpyruvate isomerase family mycothiol-dependent enzyme [unclassified Mycobacterium]|uniref:maleylpyruvate isomerase family mycothiol-dependent enzyme n=1 Tax=unclassified Mycobacterium TaxID=2642494 RepID=UPI0029C90070|nr:MULTISPECIES: maleylpyruvate isomerase family mycothiol-dependent enzyme [unclassified Mycobacterium]
MRSPRRARSVRSHTAGGLGCSRSRCPPRVAKTRSRCWPLPRTTWALRTVRRAASGQTGPEQGLRLARRADPVRPTHRVLPLGWVRCLANLNEFFVHHGDVRRANRHGPRSLTPAMDAALWRNVRRGGRYLSRRLPASGLEMEWAGTDERVTVRPGEPTARLSGPPGELLLYVFGRQAAAQVEVSGPPEAVAAVRRAHFGM